MVRALNLQKDIEVYAPNTFEIYAPNENIKIY